MILKILFGEPTIHFFTKNRLMRLNNDNCGCHVEEVNECFFFEGRWCTKLPLSGDGHRLTRNLLFSKCYHLLALVKIIQVHISDKRQLL